VISLIAILLAYKKGLDDLFYQCLFDAFNWLRLSVAIFFATGKKIDLKKGKEWLMMKAIKLLKIQMQIQMMI
jgi:hypothetical protein